MISNFLGIGNWKSVYMTLKGNLLFINTVFLKFPTFVKCFFRYFRSVILDIAPSKKSTKAAVVKSSS